MSIKFTPSSYHRARLCPPSAVLPREYLPSGEAAERGNTVHRFIPRAAEIGREAALAEIPADAPGRDLCERIAIHDVPTDYLAADAECAIAYDIATGESRRIDTADRRYGKLAATEIAGTIDALTIDASEVVIDDLKTGRPDRAHRVQLELYALMASGLAETTAAACRLIYINSDGSVTVDEWRVESLDDVHTELTATIDRVNEADRVWREQGVADVSPGDHCRYCPSKNTACPATRDAANELARVIAPESALAAFDATLATPEGRGAAWVRLPLIESLVTQMRERLNAAVIASGGTTPTGEALGAVRERGDRYVANVDAMYQRLAALGKDADAIMPATTKRKAQIGAIEKAVGKEAMRALESEGLVARGGETVRAGVVKARKSA